MYLRKCFFTKFLNDLLTKRILSSKVSHPFYPDLLHEAPADQLAVLERCESAECVSQPRVLIVGAGVAGLSAANRLLQCGIDNVTILESTERIGGRIQSCWMGDSVAELGPPWEPESVRSDGPIYPLAATEVLARPRSIPSRGLFHRPFGDDHELSVTVTAYHKFKEIEKEVSHLFSHGNSRQQGTLLCFIAQRIQQEVRNYPEEQQYDVARILFGLTSAIRSKCRADLTMVNTDQDAVYTALPGGTLRAPLGAIGALAPLLRNLPNHTIHYCKPVQTIYWGTSQKTGCRAVVRCLDGEEFSADYVIVTVSVGVLRRFCNTLFCPPLPGCKMVSLCRIGWGLCNKIFFDYCRPFYFWTKSDLRYKFEKNELNWRSDWTRGVVGIEPVPHSDHVVCVRVTGMDAVHTEGVCDRDLMEGVTQLLRQVAGERLLPYPDAVMRSRWTSDPSFCGAYPTPCCVKPCGCVNELAEPVPGPSAPVPPILLFAGDGTATQLYVGTVQGARLSGVREAERIAHLTGLLRGPPLPPEPLKQPCPDHKTDEDEKK